MARFHRIFGREGDAPDPAALAAALGRAGIGLTGRFDADAEGWWRAELETPGGTTLVLERFLAGEEGVRAELNSWAGYLESLEEGAGPSGLSPTGPIRWLMEQAIQSRQLITLSQPDSPPGPAPDLPPTCAFLARWLAGSTGGFYQEDGEGFFSAEGELLVRG